MNIIELSGFSDEACESFEEQLFFVRNLGVKYIEIRGVDGKNISELTTDEVNNVKNLLEKYKVKVSSIGSPIGKIKITNDFEPHFETYKKVLDTAKTLGTKYVRMFSFFIPEGVIAESYKDEVILRLKALIDEAKKQDIVLLHENEKEIYGDNAPRCLELMNELYCDNFKAVFDFANFVQVGQNTLEAYEMLKPYIAYVHIKDAVGQEVVPAGMGKGNVKEILADLFSNGYNGFLSLEPHLAEFSGFSKLENSGEESKKSTEGKFAWNIALNSLKAILYDLSVRTANE